MVKLFKIIIIVFVLVRSITPIYGNDDQLINTTVITTGTNRIVNIYDLNTSISSIRGYNSQFKFPENNNNKKKNNKRRHNNVLLQQSLAINNAASTINNHRSLQGENCTVCSSPFRNKNCAEGYSKIESSFQNYREGGQCVILCCAPVNNCCIKDGATVPVPTQVPVAVPVPQPIRVPVPVPRPVPGVAPIPFFVPVPVSSPGEKTIPQTVPTQPIEQTPTEVLSNTPQTVITPGDASNPTQIPTINNLPTTTENNIVPGSSSTTTSSATSSSPSTISTGAVVGIVIVIIVVLVIGFFVIRSNTKKHQSNNDTTNTTVDNKNPTNTISIENNSTTIDAAAETTSATTTKTKKDGIELSQTEQLVSQNEQLLSQTEKLLTSMDSTNKKSLLELSNALRTTNVVLQQQLLDDNDTVSGITDDVTSNASGYTIPTRTTISSIKSTDIPVVTGSIVSDNSTGTTYGKNTPILPNTLLGDFDADYDTNNDEEKTLFSKADSSEF